MTETGKRAAVIFGVALALVPLLLFTYLGLHNRLLIDDYAYLGLAREFGTWKALLFWREVWNGDYSNFLLYGLLARLAAAAPPLFTFFLCASAFVGFCWLANTLLAYLRISAYRHATVVILASLTTTATINGFYHAQVFHWLTAAVEYTWPGAMLLLGVAIASELARRLRGSLQPSFAAIAVALYAFINAGFSEMYLVFQLTSVALIAAYVAAFYNGPKRRSYVILAFAGLMGTAVSLPLQLASPGVVFRSSQPKVFEYLVIPVRDLPTLIGRALETTLHYAAHQESFASFILVVFAALFMTLRVRNRYLEELRSQTIPSFSAPIALTLIAQLLFIPVLWSHMSDSPLILSRFSYSFAAAVGINILAISVLLTLAARRDLLDKAFNRQNGLMIYCSCILLAVCFLFMMTQFRSIHYKASSYLFFTVVTLLITLAWQLAMIADEPRLKRLFWLSAFATGSAMITLLALIAVKLWGVGYIIDRTLTSVTFALMLAGFMTGVTLGTLIQSGFSMTNAKPVWLRWIRLFCLLVALTIAAGMVIGQSPRIKQARKDAEIWDSQHQEIIRLRDAGDPTVFTKSFARLLTDHLGHTPSRYKSSPLLWHQKIYYGFESSADADACRSSTAMITQAAPRLLGACLVFDKSVSG